MTRQDNKIYKTNNLGLLHKVIGNEEIESRVQSYMDMNKMYNLIVGFVAIHPQTQRLYINLSTLDLGL